MTKTKSMKRIHKVTIKRMIDDSPDTNWLGEYSNTQTSAFSIDRAHSLGCHLNTGDHLISCDDDGYCNECGCQDDDGCDCGKSGDIACHEYRYFNPSDNYKGDTPENIRKYVRQDYERMESGQRGDWCFLGICAEAIIKVQIGESKYSREFDPLSPFLLERCGQTVLLSYLVDFTRGSNKQRSLHVLRHRHARAPK